MRPPTPAPPLDRRSCCCAPCSRWRRCCSGWTSSSGCSPTGRSTWPRRSTPWSRAARSRRCWRSAWWRSWPACWSRCCRASAVTSLPRGWPGSSSTCCSSATSTTWPCATSGCWWPRSRSPDWPPHSRAVAAPMSDTPTFAIVGAGLAGAKAAEALRAEGFDGHVVLLGAEAHQPYERPPLSKGYLQGSADRDTVFVHKPAWYGEHQIDLRLDTTVTALDRRAHELVTADGSRTRYDKLLLTTGASPRRLPVPGADLAGVRYLRSLDDSDDLKASLRPGARVVISGAGWIGLETAAAARG